MNEPTLEELTRAADEAEEVFVRSLEELSRLQQEQAKHLEELAELLGV